MINQLYQDNAYLSSDTMEQLRPAAYYAVLPATVRYNDTLSSSAKLLYGEISALITRDGYCWAQNQYFADLYKTTERTVARWLALLEDCGFIHCEVLRATTGGKITGRYISLANAKVSTTHGQPHDKIVSTNGQNCPDVRTKMSPLLDNTSIYNYNNIYIGADDEKKKCLSMDKLQQQFSLWIQGVGATPEETSLLLEAYTGFLENRAAMKKPVKTERAVTILCNRLAKFCGSDFTKMAELLDDATAHNWQTVYQPKDGGANGSNSRVVEEGDIIWT